MTRFRRALLASAALLGVVAIPVSAPDAAVASGLTSVRAPIVELVAQTPTVAQGGTFEMFVRLPEVPEDGSLELVLHGRVRSRSELERSMEGSGLRSQIYAVATLIATLPVGPDGSRQISLPLDPAVPGGVALTSSGAYPLEVVARDAGGATLATLVTHVLVRPAEGDQSPPLAVAVVAEVDAPPALQPEGGFALPSAALAGASELVAALRSVPDADVTLAVRPETLDALAASDDPADATLIDDLRAAARGRSVLAMPYVDVSPDALASAGLDSELRAHLDRGRLVLENVLGQQPNRSSWLADDDLDERGLRVLHELGVRQVIVTEEQLEPLRAGVLSLSLAQPFLLEANDVTTLDAVALDPAVLARIGTRSSSGLEVSRLLAELAMLWFEQPGIPRGVVVPLDPSVRGQVVESLLTGLRAGGMFEAVGIDELFDRAGPLRQPGGGRVDRALVPERADRISQSFVTELRAGQALLGSFAQMLGPGSPRAEPVGAQLLVATARGLSDSERRAHVAAARSAIEDVTGAVSAPDHGTITLTARDGKIPLTLRNDSGVPVNVSVRLRSPKLEFPGGDTIPVTLTEPTTRLDIAVRARASGSFPLDVSITSPDGVLTLAIVDYSVQSTAVSGVGVVLSVGAAFFLMIWWARHWRRTRRSRKLVAAKESDTAVTSSL